MKELIEKVYEEKLKDGTIEKIVEEQIKKMVEDACRNLFSWNGEIKKQFEAKLNETMKGLIDRTNLNDYTNCFVKLINETIPQTQLGVSKDLIDSIKECLGREPFDKNKTVKLSEIFRQYREFISNDITVNEDCLDDTSDVESGSYSLNVSMESEDYYGDTKVKFFISDDNYTDDYEKDKKYEIKLLNYSKFSLLKYKSDEIRLSDLTSLNKFESYLLALDIHHIKIEADIEDDEDYAEVMYEYR